MLAEVRHSKMTRFIVACGGPDKIVNGVRNCLLRIDNESLMHRNVRLSLLYSDDVILTLKDGDIRDAPECRTEYTDHTIDEYAATRHLWNTDGYTAIILGDSYISDELMGLVAHTYSYELSFRVFGRHEGSKLTGCPYGEGYILFWHSDDNELLDEVLGLARKLPDEAPYGVKSILGWRFHRLLNGLDPYEHVELPTMIDLNYFLPDDLTEDFDCDRDWEEHPLGGGRPQA